MTRKAVCTICAKNYLHFARTLMDSLRQVEPDWDQYVLLADEIRGAFNPAREPFHVVEVTELPLPNPRAFLFRYTLLELNTAVKPWLLEWLFDRKGYDQVVYMDPDIYVYAPLREAERLLDAGHFMVLTPHLTGPLDDDAKPSELDIILKAGTYNLGFIALARHEALGPFLRWWQGKLEYDCVVDYRNGIFVDQKWMDIVPGMFGRVAVLRHEGYNVAYWNLKHRKVTRTQTGFTVNGQPLVFFHFSGLDPLTPSFFSKHQDRYRLKDLGPERELVTDYCTRVIENGLATCREWPYAFGTFADGTPIEDEMRQHFRQHLELAGEVKGDPFEIYAGYFRKRPPRRRWQLRRLARRILPQRLKNWIKQTVLVPPSGSMSRRQRILRRIAGWVPGFVKRSARVMIGPAAAPQAAESTALTLERRLARTCYVGFFDENLSADDRGLAWMGPSASVRILEPKAGTLTISGEYTPRYHRRAGGSKRTVLRVSLDGAHVADVTLHRKGRFEQRITLPQPASPAGAMLTLDASQSFVPVQIGLGEDSRTLSVRIGRILLDDTVILDFASYPDCFMPASQVKRPEMGLNIVGYLKSEHGVGESARLCVMSAEAVLMDYALVDISDECVARADDHRLSHLFSGQNPHPVNLFHVNADQTSMVWHCLGKAFFDNRYNIAFWHWELPEFPDDWLASFEYLQEVWVPSQFVMDAVSAKSPVPVVRMPHAFGFSVPRDLRRSDLDLPGGKFLFLMVYDMASYQERKNPRAAVEAFTRAFPDPKDVGLVIKTMNTENAPKEWAALEKELSEVPGVITINRMFTRQEVYNLEALCDCFVSLHRSEGFGLGLAESMCLGKPVIGTNWSGNVDFMTVHNSCPVDYTIVELDRSYGPYRKGQHWAEPDTDHAAYFMKKLVEDAAWRRRIGEAARRTMHTQFSHEVVGKRYQERLKVILRRL